MKPPVSRFPAWPPFALIALILLGWAAVFLFPSAWEFPMDDTYIHFVYAKNLAARGQLMFNTPGETGVGTTSLTWVLLLAGAYRLGIPLQLAAKGLGLLALFGVGWGIYLLFKPILRPLPALALALLVSASGHLLWFALSGMETVLFLALGILALLLYRDKRWAALGMTLGLLALTRPDGLALSAAIGLVEGTRLLFSRSPRGQWKPLLVTFLLCGLVCAPWFGYLLWRTGHLLPTSAVGKQVSSLIGIQLVTAHSPTLAALARFPALIYAGTWAAYLLEFVLGGMALPGPGLAVGASLGSDGYTISYLGILGWILIIAPLLYSFARGLAGFIRERAYRQVSALPLLALAAWVLLHNLAYAFFLPIPGTASRYGAVNHLALWLALLFGLLRWRSGPRWRQAALGLAVGLVVLAAANTFYWNRVYDANLEHMLNVRIAAARYVIASLPPTEPCAAFDVGVLRYYADRPITDLGGLIDPALGSVYRSDGRIDRYLTQRGARCVILPGQTGTTEQGWFDFAKEMGLTTSPYFKLEQEQVFAITQQRWLLGYLPTNNYQATVTIYRLVYPDAP